MTTEELIERLKETPGNYQVVIREYVGNYLQNNEVIGAIIDTQTEEVLLVIKEDV